MFRETLLDKIFDACIAVVLMMLGISCTMMAGAIAYYLFTHGV